MSPLLFLAIAIVVPLLGMIVLGIGARIKHQKATDDETEPFRRRLESIAPPDTDDTSPGTPGLVGTMRRRRGGSSRKQAPGTADAVPDEAEPAGHTTAAIEPAVAATADAEIGERHGRRRNRRAARQPAALIPAQKPRAPASIRLVERDYTVPQLPPLSTDLEEFPPPAGDQRSRRAVPRPPEAERRHDRVISANQRPNQGRHPGS